MWTEEIRNNICKELAEQLDNNTFYNPSKFSSSTLESSVTQSKVASKASDTSYIGFGYKPSESSNSSDFYSTTGVKGMSFSNKIESEKKTNTVKELTGDSLKIYSIADLLASNYAETSVISYATVPQNLALTTRFDWKDVFFSDVGKAWGMIKQRFFK